MMATCALDKTVTIWDTFNSSIDKSSILPPKAKINKDMKVGKLFTLNFYPSSPWLLGCGGGAKEIALWDMTQDTTIQKIFGGRTKIPTKNDVKDDETREKEENEKKQIFDSMMKSDDSNAPTKSISDTETKKSSSSSKKKKNKNKKAPHRAGR
jgi:WD40 repeat protein